MTFGRGVRNVEGMVEMNAAPVVSPLNSLDCARINVGPGEGKGEEEEREVKKKRVAAGKCQYQARVVAKKGRREEWEKGEREKERERRGKEKEKREKEGENNSRVSRRVSTSGAYLRRWVTEFASPPERRRLSGLIPNKLQS